MAQAYFSLVTHAGRIKLAQSAAGGDPVTITHFAVGDGNGADTNPTTNSTALVREVWRTQVESVATDPDNPSAILVTAIIPTNAGGWWMREFGIFDTSGTMIAVARPVSQYKPTALEGQLEDIRYEFQIIIGEAANVTLLVDPSLIFATRDWVQTRKIAMTQMTRLPWLPVMSMTTTVPPANAVQGDAYLVPSNASGAWSGKGGMIAEWIGTAWAYSTPTDGHGVSLPDARLFIRVAGQYVELLASDIRAGLVELATIAEAKAGKDTGRAVTPAGLAAAIAEAITTLVNGSPAAMDTLRELADALGNDTNFAASMTNALAGKVDLTRTATDTRTGIVELATPAEAKAGTDKERAVTPEGLAASLANVTPPRPNLCPHGGFELGQAGVEASKAGVAWPAQIVDNQWGRSLALSAPLSDGTYTIVWPLFPVSAGIAYTISGDAAFLAASGTVRYDLAWYNASGAVISYSASKARGTGDFDDSAAGRQSMAVSVVAPAGAVSARLRCIFESVTTPIALYVRRAKVEKGALPATAYTTPVSTYDALKTSIDQRVSRSELAGLVTQQISKYKPATVSQQSFHNGTTASITLSITAPCPGVLIAIGNTVYSYNTSGANSSSLVLNGSTVAIDKTSTSRPIAGSVDCVAGTQTAQLTGASTGEFSLNLTLIFIPNLGT